MIPDIHRVSNDTNPSQYVDSHISLYGCRATPLIWNEWFIKTKYGTDLNLDRLLDLGFKQDIQGILGRLPKQRRTGLFSASVSEAVSEIIRVGLRNPVKISVRVKTKSGNVIEERKTPASLQMTYLMTPAQKKLPFVARLLQHLEPRPLRSIIFLSTCAAVDYFSHILPALLPEGFQLNILHGKQDAKVREKAITKFLNVVEPSILLTTDLAARG